MLRVVGCFLEYDGKIVLLLRHAHKPNGNTWGLPAGKVEVGEEDATAILRELWEETGYQASPQELQYIREDVYEFDDAPPVFFVVYKVELTKPHSVQIEEAAHQQYQWATPGEAYQIPNLVPGLHKAIELVGYLDN